MNRQVQIYIEGQRIELFNDEKITINSSVQNISDISKTYTDFSQSFTIPASVNNNKIFQHFYANEVDSTLDYNIRRTAYIEIDLIPFRTGKIQLEKAQLKNGQVDNYTITFYGDLVTLKDLFGEDKLNSLDYTAYTHIYTGANIQTRISSDSLDYDVRWPLISSSRVWQYGGGGGGGAGSNNIASSSHPIVYTELFPALRVSKIFDEIERSNKFSITSNEWNSLKIGKPNVSLIERISNLYEQTKESFNDLFDCDDKIKLSIISLGFVDPYPIIRNRFLSKPTSIK
jgi:hypothetical protein